MYINFADPRHAAAAALGLDGGPLGGRHGYMHIIWIDIGLTTCIHY